MQPLAVDPRVLRAVLGAEIKVMPGRALMARVVVADGQGRGSLSIAGFLVEAELPKDVRTGEDLRLVVRDVTPERVTLSLADEHQSQPAVPDMPAPVTVPLPGGATLQVTERDPRGGAEAGSPSHTLSLRFQAPALGDVDLRFALDAGALALGVTVDPGEPLDAARADAAALRAALAGVMPRAVSVTVAPRRQPLDVYA
jgi:hypothetical protein